MARLKGIVVGVALALLVGACTETAGDTTTSTVSTASTSSTTVPRQTTTTEPQQPRWDDEDDHWRADPLTRVVFPDDAGWYKDIAAHRLGVMAVGVRHDGLTRHPAAWLTRETFQWLTLNIPDDIEGWFEAVAANEERTVMVGYDTGAQTGMIFQVPAGEDPVRVEYDGDFQLTEVVATPEGFIVYPATTPFDSRPHSGVLVSPDGMTWVEAPRSPVEVAEVVQMGDFALEVPLSTLSEPTLIQPSQFFDPTSWDSEFGPPEVGVLLAESGEDSRPYSMSAVDTDAGFLIGGGDFRTETPGLWEVSVNGGLGDATSVEAELVFSGWAPGSRVNGRFAEIRHITRHDGRFYAVVGASTGGIAEMWSSTDLSTWTVEEVVSRNLGGDERFRSAQTVLRALEGRPETGDPTTFLVSSGTYPPDLWRLHETPTKLSDFDHLQFQPTEVPLFVGSVHDSLYARIVEHGPRSSQAEIDDVRSRLFAKSANEWTEVGTTAWQTGSRIQAVVEVGGDPVAFAPGEETDMIFEIESGRLGESSAGRGGSMYNAVGIPNRAVVFNTHENPAVTNRLSVAVTENLTDWEGREFDDTSNTFITAVCSGMDRAWMATDVRFTRQEIWASADGLTWSRANPVPTGDEDGVVGPMTACGGDTQRVVVATQFDPRLMETTDALTWTSLDPPSSLTANWRIEEVAVLNEWIAIVAQSEHPFVQPHTRAFVWDGIDWHELDPEPGSGYHSVAFHDSRLHLGGVTSEGHMVWSTELN